MTETGEIPCGLCGEWLFIGAFYSLEVVEGVTAAKDIWWGDPVTGKQYGRPKSYCRICNQVSQKGPEAVRKYREAMVTRNELREHDIRKAELAAHREKWTRENPTDPQAFKPVDMDALKRAMSM